MAELITLARPYAKAAFQAAREHDQLETWSGALANLAVVVSDSEMQRVVEHPNLSTQQKIEIISDVCDGQLSEPVLNLLRMMAENQRLTLVPAVAGMFSDLRHEHEKTVDVNLTTAFEMTDEQQKKLSEALSRKLDRKVTMTSNVDQSIIGGVLIEAGDTVIDASVRGKLSRLASAMRS